MRNTLIVSTLLLCVAGAARAQPSAPPPRVLVNCDALNKGTFICVQNATPRAVNRITCSGFWGSTALNIPGGIISPNEITIVDFQAGKCAKHITVGTSDGHTYQFDGFDTTSNTKLLIDNE